MVKVVWGCISTHGTKKDEYKDKGKNGYKYKGKNENKNKNERAEAAR